MCIFGAGAMGTSLGAALSQAGVPVELVSRNAAHVEALRTRGAVLTGPVSMTVPVTAMLPEEMAGKYDIIFLAIRQRGNREAAQRLMDAANFREQIENKALNRNSRAPTMSEAPDSRPPEGESDA